MFYSILFFSISLHLGNYFFLQKLHVFLNLFKLDEICFHELIIIIIIL